MRSPPWFATACATSCATTTASPASVFDTGKSPV